MLESVYQRELKPRIEVRFPGCIILENDPKKLQGILDLTVLCPGGFWAALEVKPDPRKPFRPNQEHYIYRMHEMSFAACIFPENEEEVLSAMEQAYRTCWEARAS